MPAPAGVVNVGGEWYYDDYAPGRGVASLGVDTAPALPVEVMRRRPPSARRRRPRSATASSTCSATRRARAGSANSSGWPGLRGRLARQVGEKLLAGLGVDPGGAVVAEVIAARPRRQPDFLQRLLQVDDQLAAVAES